MPSLRPGLLGPVLLIALVACEREGNEASESPYAARMAATQAAYVRVPSSARTRAMPNDSAKESFVQPEFTADQSSRGAKVYAAGCARCHAVAQWTGGTFAATWQD